jgi:hypothetical protein
MSECLQRTYPAEEHFVEEQVLLQEQKLKREKSLIYTVKKKK